MVLEVHQQLKGDVYRDVVRIPERHRRDSLGQLVPEGTIVKLITCDGASKVVWLRGMEGKDAAWIRMDEKTRNDLGVVTGQSYHFRIERVRVGRPRWALDSSNPAHYIAAWLAVISAALSILGFVVGGALALLR